MGISQPPNFRGAGATGMGTGTGWPKPICPALFHAAFRSHPKARVYPTPKVQFGGWCPAPCAPLALPCHEPLAGHAGVLVPISIPVALLLGPGMASEPSACLPGDTAWWLAAPVPGRCGTASPTHASRACWGSATTTALPPAKRRTGGVTADFPLGAFSLFSRVKQQHGGKNPTGRQALALAGGMAARQ